MTVGAAHRYISNDVQAMASHSGFLFSFTFMRTVITRLEEVISSSCPVLLLLVSTSAVSPHTQ